MTARYESSDPDTFHRTLDRALGRMKTDDDLRALFDRALYQAFPGRMTHVRDKENADRLWLALAPLLVAARTVTP